MPYTVARPNVDPMVEEKRALLFRSSCSEPKSSEVASLCTILSTGVRRSPKRTRDAPSVDLTDGASIKLSNLPYAHSRRNGTNVSNCVFKPPAMMELHIGKELVESALVSFQSRQDASLEVAEGV